ncbi:hypothetical protein M8818_001026 [Zalaria obscura]|uniref:Uncharacterized protein n=1 Tax=Zalaria obscura TaxID=2024903 RepID=A0ACC3SLE4_9PEZI
MLCHNCDQWHLPEPCKLEWILCPGCGQLGHFHKYCPVSPAPMIHLAEPATKRQRTEHGDHNTMMDTPQQQSLHLGAQSVGSPTVQDTIRQRYQIAQETRAANRPSTVESARNIHISSPSHIDPSFHQLSSYSTDAHRKKH